MKKLDAYKPCNDNTWLIFHSHNVVKKWWVFWRRSGKQELWLQEGRINTCVRYELSNQTSIRVSSSSYLPQPHQNSTVVHLSWLLVACLVFRPEDGDSRDRPSVLNENMSPSK
jgi:hypothetical protein